MNVNTLHVFLCYELIVSIYVSIRFNITPPNISILVLIVQTVFAKDALGVI